MCLARVFESCAETLLNVFRARARQVLEAQLSTAALVIGAGYGTLLLLLDRGPGAVVQFLVVYAGLRLALTVFLGTRTGLLAGVSLQPLLPLELGALRAHGQGLLVLAGIFLCGTFFNRVQPLFIKQYQGLTEVALFGSSYDLSGGVLSIISLLILGRVVFPHLVAVLGQDRARFQALVGVHLRRLVLVGAALTFFFFLRGRGPAGPDLRPGTMPGPLFRCRSRPGPWSRP